ncbi:MAG: hypothetical protein FD146_697 [Anaerolineaceae bacterium]|nr:MAG: hypothetical protein FD146_697 [Anaerolineaceae bacterium]
MYATGAELLFPPRVIPALAEARGPLWRDLVTAAAKWADASLEQTALTLMMARLNNCAACTADSYRAIRGCEACSKQTLRRFRGPDEELLRLYDAARIEVTRFLQKKPLAAP